MLPKEVKERLATEFRFAADQMLEAQDMPNKLYFFSVFFSEAQRMLNLNWDPDLALIHLVARDVYRQINARVNEVASGQDRVVGLIGNIPEELEKVSGDLAAIFEAEPMDKASLLHVLSRMAELAYLTSGNGKYLALRGHVTI